MNIGLIFPIIVSVVQLVERIFGGGNGSQKKTLAVQILVLALSTYEKLSGKEIVDEVKLAETVGPLIDGVVELLNMFGVFSKSTAK